jgi:hypothetical protein
MFRIWIRLDPILLFASGSGRLGLDPVLDLDPGLKNNLTILCVDKFHTFLLHVEAL